MLSRSILPFADSHTHTHLLSPHCPSPPPHTHRQHFHKDVRKQLYSEDDDRSFFNRIKDALKGTEARLEEGRVALQHLEMFLLNVACDDPGAAIGTQLVLPLLQVI